MNRGPLPGKAAVDHAAKARAAWGGNAPEWIIILAEACNRSSQSAVAKDLGYSGSAISLVIGNTYNGDLVRIEQMVRGALMAETVRCPILGELERNVCEGWQRKPFATTSAHRIRMYQTCHGACPNSRVSTQKREVDDAV